MSADQNAELVPIVLDLEDPYFDSRTLTDALRDYDHVHSTTGVCVKNNRGPFCSGGVKS